MGNVSNYETNPYAFMEDDDKYEGTSFLSYLSFPFRYLFGQTQKQKIKAEFGLPLEQLIAKYEETRQRGETMFTLPEYQ